VAIRPAAIIDAMRTCGLTECELWSPQIEPAAPGGRGRTPEQIRETREAVRTWRLSTPLDQFRGIKEAFGKIGASIYAYNYSFGNDFTDDEINRGFEHARALGAEIITASTNLTVAKRVVPFAEQHKMAVAVHNHSNTKGPERVRHAGEFRGSHGSVEVFQGQSRHRPLHRRELRPGGVPARTPHGITNLHLKDRKRNQGDNTPWGTGDTQIREVLALLKREKWPIRAYIEYEYRGAAGPVEEVKQCFDYAKAALA
jgi:hypothetical protein